MISIADLNALRGNPQTAYDQYPTILREAKMRALQPVDPRAMDDYWAMLRLDTTDWVMAVLGWDAPADLHRISCTDAEMLMLADERGLDPALPPWLVQWKAESAETAARQEEARLAVVNRDRDRWAQALAGCVVPVEVRPNLNQHIHGGRRQSLMHAVPLADVMSGKTRIHRAGRALCETGRARPLPLGEPDNGSPGTCVRCLQWMGKIREAA